MKRRPVPSLRRNRAKKLPKTTLYIFCEGKTEPDYFEWFRQEVGNAAVNVVTIPESGVPKTLVSRAVQKKKELKRKYRKQDRSSFDALYEFWGVFDVDEHPHLQEAKITARDNDISLAISNPCFELWGLLHVQDQTAYIERHKLQRKLSQVMHGYHHKRKPYFIKDTLRGRHDEAADRAVCLLKHRRLADDVGGNPSTGVHVLCQKIKDGGKS